MTREDQQIWNTIRERSLVGQMAWYYLTGEYWMNRAWGLYKGDRI